MSSVAIPRPLRFDWRWPALLLSVIFGEVVVMRLRADELELPIALVGLCVASHLRPQWRLCVIAVMLLPVVFWLGGTLPVVLGALMLFVLLPEK